MNQTQEITIAPEKNALYTWRYIKAPHDTILVILHIEHVVICNECGNFCTRDMGHWRCKEHNGDFISDDLLIYYTIVPYTHYRILKRGWKRRTGEEVRSGRYGLVTKEERDEKKRQEHLLNMITVGEFKHMLEDGEEVYAVLLSSLMDW